MGKEWEVTLLFNLRNDDRAARSRGTRVRANWGYRDGQFRGALYV